MMTMRGIMGMAVVVLLSATAGTGGVVAQQTGTRTAATVVVFETSKGAIEIELDPRAPETVANFLKYVDAGAYTEGQFHRVVRPETESRTDFPIQVIQASQNAQQPRFPAIALERTRDTGLRHVDGAVSMARAGVDTARSDFFICIGAQPELDFAGKRNADGQGFAVFGRVVKGMEVVKAIQQAPVRAGTQTPEPPIRILGARRKPATSSDRR